MVVIQIIFLALFAVAQARFVPLQALEDQPYTIELAGTEEELGDILQHFEPSHPTYLNRARRQLGSLSTNPDGSANLNLKVPIAKGESSVLSALGSVSGIQLDGTSRDAGVKTGPGYGSAGGGLALDNINGHGLSLTGLHIPGLGNQAMAAGRLGLINTPDHKLGANAFVSRTMPNIPDLPNFNTYGGSVDYTFKDKIGGSLGMSHTDLFKRTNYSAMGNLNLFRNPSSSLDLNAGFTKSRSPIPAYNHNWQPQAGLSFTKYF